MPSPFSLFARHLFPVALATIATGCISDNANWSLRLDDATICSDVEWDNDGDAPDPTVIVTANWDGSRWSSSTLDDTWTPQWSQAVWDGEPATTEELRDFGVLVTVEDDDFLSEDVIDETSIQFDEEDFKVGAFNADMGCVMVSFSVLEADDSESDDLTL